MSSSIVSLKPAASLYFIGIGGTGMSAVAILAYSRGFRVSGSDFGVYPPTSTLLKKAGISFFSPYDATHLDTKVDLVVVGGGERPEHNPEIQKAKELGLPIVSFPEVLRSFWDLQHRIVVSGTHGKTTTTSLLSWILDQGNLQPGFLIGGYAPNLGSSMRDTNGPWVIIEGDEYASSAMDDTSKFLHYQPEIAIITNIELDHPDQFGSLEEVKAAFRRMVERLPRNGLLVANADDSNVVDVARASRAPIQWISLNARFVDWSAQDLHATIRGVRGIIVCGNRLAFRFHSQLHGVMNVRNLLCAIAVARYVGVSWSVIVNAISSFQAPARRSEVKGEKQGILVLDDFAHHPTAVRETLRGHRARFPNRRLWVVFEPHTYSRTQALLTDYQDAFEDADEVLIADIVGAREDRMAFSVTRQDLVDVVSQSHPSVHNTPTRDDAKRFLLSHLRPGDVVIIMAVGSFQKLAQDILDGLPS
jgi:UDP-N-acetylmuramate: L-alanyl-gamma-D-glutamyl-meso-diaminopimelate ligase